MADKNIIGDTLAEKKLTCKDCGNLFLFTVAEQELYLTRGLKHEPARCPICRKKYREAQQAMMEPVKCRMCKKRGFVTQIPEGDVDVLCEECFIKVKESYMATQPQEPQVAPLSLEPDSKPPTPVEPPRDEKP